jgi:hypothetical protein
MAASPTSYTQPDMVIYIGSGIGHLCLALQHVIMMGGIGVFTLDSSLWSFGNE